MIDPKPNRVSLPLSRAFHPFQLCAAIYAVFALPQIAAAQADSTPQQPPAPIVRVRPHSQTVPQTAPPDAAPLAVRPPRPHPVNPQNLSGIPATTGSTATPASHPHPSTPSVASPGSAASAAKPASSSEAADGKAADHASAAPKLSAVLNRDVIVLDPAHGGADSGSRIGDNLLEKNVTLALAFRLRTLLAARGFTVILTRDSDAAVNQASPNSAPTPLTLDDRAGIANHARAAACLLLHATGRGTGVHLYNSELDPAPGEGATLPWLTAQAAWVPASQQLGRSIASALGRSHISLVDSAASVRPVDSLTCPALVLELAPETSDPHTVNDAGYQEGVAQAIAGALVFWENQVQTPTRLAATTPATHAVHHHTTPVPEEHQP